MSRISCGTPNNQLASSPATWAGREGTHEVQSTPDKSVHVSGAPDPDRVLGSNDGRSRWSEPMVERQCGAVVNELLHPCCRAAAEARKATAAPADAGARGDTARYSERGPGGAGDRRAGGRRYCMGHAPAAASHLAVRSF